MNAFLEGNHVRLLRNGVEYFPALELALDQARHEIFVETYIFRNDREGARIATALMRAAGRGVLTHLVIDGFGSRDFPDDLRSRMVDAGVQILVFRPEVARLNLRRHRLRRLHRKLAVIDGRVGFCGGINIIDDFTDIAPDMLPRFDFAVQIEGPLMTDLVLTVRQLWVRLAWTNFKRQWRPVIRPEADRTPRGLHRAALVIRDNLRHRRDIEAAYLVAMQEAKSEIFIANAYFLPGKTFRNALMEASQRGVRVVLLLQGRVENLLLHFATRALYGHLRSAGIQIHEYRKSFLHAKVAVIDGRWATVGSSNIDPFSLFLAREANIIVDNESFAETLRMNLQAAMHEAAIQVSDEGWGFLSLPTKMLSWIAYGLARAMAGLTGYARGEFN
jgi:cardiolipin synthase